MDPIKTCDAQVVITAVPSQNTSADGANVVFMTTIRTTAHYGATTTEVIWLNKLQAQTLAQRLLDIVNDCEDGL